VLPADFGVAPEGRDPTRRVSVEIDAVGAGETLFTNRAVTSFVEGRTLRLDMFLAERCLEEAETCREDETCRREGCAPAEIDARDLPTFGDQSTTTVDLAGGPDPLAGDWGTEGRVLDLAVAPDGTAYLAGTFSGTADLGDRVVEAPGDHDAFLIALARDGSVLWFHALGATGFAVAFGVDVDAGGSAYLVGTFAGDADLGRGPVTADTESMFLASYDPTGAARWSHVRGAGYTTARDVDVHSDRVLVAGSYAEAIDLGGPALPDPEGAESPFLATYDLDGGHLWSCSPDNRGNETVNAARLVGEGAVVIGDRGPGDLWGAAGRFDDRCDAGWLIEPLWESNPEETAGLLVMGEELVLAIDVYGETAPIWGPLPDHGDADGLVARLSADGQVLWAERFGGEGVDTAWALADAPGGGILVAGSFEDRGEIAGLPLRGDGRDAFVAKIGDDGRGLWTRVFGGSGDDAAWAIALDGEEIVVAGHYEGTALFGSEVRTAPEGGAVFVHRFREE
jgi:hypothetical protein